MRALATIAAMVLAGAALTSCDMPGSGQQQAAAAPCNCAATPPAPAEHLTRLSYAPEVRHHYRRHRYYRTAHYDTRSYGAERYSDESNASYAQQSVDAYDYVSTSRVSRSSSASYGYAAGYGGSGYSQSGYGESGYGQSGYSQGYGDGRIVWVDGYGRGYYAGRPPTVAKTMRGDRMKPYHGYLVDCPDGWAPD